MNYELIYADPPWSYDNTASNGAAENHYGTMKLIDIKRLPVWELSAENAVLAMWYTGTHVCIDGVIAAVLISNGHNGLFDVLLDRYRYRKSKRLMAEQLQKRHPEWCYMTCRRRIDSWLSLAEFMLYAPMCDAFGTNSSRFKLQCEPEGA